VKDADGGVRRTRKWAAPVGSGTTSERRSTDRAGEEALSDEPLVTLPGNEMIYALPEDLRRAAESGALINVFRVLLHAPDIAEPVIRLGSAQFAAGSISPVDRELLILACGALFEAPYEEAQHGPISRAVGITDEQRAAVAHHRWKASCFTTAQHVLLTFVARIAHQPTAPDPLASELRAHFDDRQVVEIVVLVGYYFLIARLSTVLRIPVDAPHDDRMLRAGRDIHQHGIHQHGATSNEVARP
jgi:4-carboxymuconolactone decarboxylase